MLFFYCWDAVCTWKYCKIKSLYFVLPDACKEFSDTVATAYGPNGMNKMVINHLEKLFVTNDAATIIRELEVEHPAAKMMILGSQMMEQEVITFLKSYSSLNNHHHY